MKNLQISNQDLVGNKFNGHDLHLYLQENGIISKSLVVDKRSNDPETFAFDNNLDENFTRAIIKNELFLESDIVHLHLIHNTDFDLNYLPLMSKLKPVVITLHDPYFLGGHCIHHFDCEKWKTHCYDCTKLDVPFEIKSDDSALNFEQKKNIIQNSNISAIVASKWIEDKVKQSPIWRGKKIYRVPFGINQEVFKSSSKIEVKKKLGISQDSITLMIRGSDNPYKGLDIIQETLKNINKKKIHLIIVYTEGEVLKYIKKHPFKNKTIYKWVEDDNLLAQLYQASDLFLMPSSAETFGMMAIEAMSCGTPVLATKGTALEDVINAPECGIAVEHNVKAFTQELQRLIDNPEELKIRGQKSLDFAKVNYNKDIYVKRIIEAYNDIIQNHEADDDVELTIAQLLKYSVAHKKSLQINNFGENYKENICTCKKVADDKFKKLYYRLIIRPFLKKAYGKEEVRNKYDKRFL